MIARRLHGVIAVGDVAAKLRELAPCTSPIPTGRLVAALAEQCEGGVDRVAHARGPGGRGDLGALERDAAARADRMARARGAGGRDDSRAHEREADAEVDRIARALDVAHGVLLRRQSPRQRRTWQ